MGVRGRKSAKELELTVISSHGIEAVRRPEAPAELTDEQAEEWREIVNTLPADWFMRANYPLLAQYCRHVVAARHIAALINAAENDPEFDQAHHARLLKRQEAESRIIADLAGKMRLSQRSTRSDRQQTKLPKPFKKPWDAD